MAEEFSSKMQTAMDAMRGNADAERVVSGKAPAPAPTPEPAPTPQSDAAGVKPVPAPDPKPAEKRDVPAPEDPLTSVFGNEKPAEKTVPEPTPKQEPAFDMEAATAAMSTKGREHFKRLETIKNAEIAELKKQLAERDNNTKPPAEYETKLAQLQRERDELEAVVAKVAVERSPVIKSRFDQPIQKAMDEAKKLIAEIGGNPEDVAAALSKGTWREISDALTAITPPEATPYDTNALTDLARRILRTRSEKQEFIDAGRAKLEEAEREEILNEGEQLKQAAQARREVFPNIIADLAKTDGVLRILPGDHPDIQAWNAEAQAIPQRALEMVEGAQSFQDFAVMAARAAQVQPLYALAQKLHLQKQEQAAKIGKLEAQIAELTSATPRPASGGNTTNPADPSFMGRFNERMKGE